MSAAQLPWIVPVPVRRSDFTPLRPADAACNVEVELGRIGAFAHRRRPLPEHALLFADLQLNPDVNANRRFGSGRAGVHAGRYVKGVGRTLLAGNWNDPDDLYHNSGLQLASAGVRELLVSEYLRREGLGRVIVPCEGLLARRLPPAFRGHLRSMFGPRKVDHRGLDARLQTITHKPAGFARLSNFVWWLGAFPQQLAGGSAFGRLFELFAAAVAAPGAAAGPSPGPDEIAEGFARAVQRGVDGFFAAWRAGVSWGSVSNNFTADGRFLDLETPAVLGGPFVGTQRNALEIDGPPPERVRPNQRGHFFGLEVVRYVKQATTFARFLIARLQFLTSLGWAAPVEAQFVARFNERLVWHLRSTCPLLRPRAMIGRIADELAATLAAAGGERRLLRCMVHHAFAGPAFLAQPRGPAGLDAYRACSFVRLDAGDITPIEPGFRLLLYVPEFLRERVQPHRERAQRFHDALASLQRSADLDDCLARLDAAVAGLRRPPAA